MELVWEKPVIIFYKERLKKPERKAFAVIKAKKLIVLRAKEDAEFKGNIQDFFPLMGDIDFISSAEGKSEQYVLCWFDDKEDDFNNAWRRLNGVTFLDGITFITDKKGKRTYNANFKAKRGKVNGGRCDELS